MDQTVPSVFDELEEARPLNYASTGQRFLNYIIDIIVFYAVLFLISMLYAIIALMMETDPNAFFINEDAGVQLLKYLIVTILWLSTYTIIEGASKGRTLGKLITGTRAVRENGSSITWKDALMRSLCRIVPFEPFSAFTGNLWHDKWTDTTVIKTR